MDYGKYKNLRNASWQCLIDCDVTELPVHVTSLVKHYGGKICKDSDVNILEPNQSGKIYFFSDTEWYVIVDDSDSTQRQRYTVMHELGHYLLGHFGITPLSRSYSEIKPTEETEADSFAVRVLAPACVIWGLDLHTPQEISNICNISYTAARYRAERMKLLYDRNKFLTHPLEQELYKQFESFIYNNKKCETL